jgi:hypothetical protein
MTEKPSSGPNRRPPYAESPGSRRPDYDQFAPGVGYTPPYTPPPDSSSARGGTAWQRYSGLRRRARADSMSWWAMKALQGLLIGGGPFVLGIVLIMADKLLGAGQAWSWVGFVLLLTGLLIILRYALAPATCKWIVTVPENRFCVIEDNEGYTAEYLEPGRWMVTWRWNAKVRDYVDFNAVTVNTQITDVLGGSGPAVDMDVTVVMAFNPAQADSHAYAQLRQMTTRDQFETLIAREVRDSVHKYFRLLTPDQQRSAARNPRALEEYLSDQLEHYRTMGLSLASSRPVMVHISGAPAPQAPYPPPVFSPWTQPNPHARPDEYYTPPQIAPQYTPPPDPRPTERHVDPPAAEPSPPPAADAPSPAPPAADQPPPVKGADHVDDPLTLRRRRRDRDRD